MRRTDSKNWRYDSKYGGFESKQGRHIETSQPCSACKGVNYVFFKWLKVKLLNITYLIFFFFLAHCLGIRTIWRTKSQTCLFMYFSRFSVFPNTSNRIYVLWSWSWCPITSTILLINWFLDIFPWIFNFECIWKIYLLFYC